MAFWILGFLWAKGLGSKVIYWIRDAPDYGKQCKILALGAGFQVHCMILAQCISSLNYYLDPKTPTTSLCKKLG